MATPILYTIESGLLQEIKATKPHPACPANPPFPEGHMFFALDNEVKYSIGYRPADPRQDFGWLAWYAFQPAQIEVVPYAILGDIPPKDSIDRVVFDFRFQTGKGTDKLLLGVNDSLYLFEDKTVYIGTPTSQDISEALRLSQFDETLSSRLKRSKCQFQQILQKIIVSTCDNMNIHREVLLSVSLGIKSLVDYP